MGALDIARELLIKIGVTGGAEARAEVEATGASLEKVTAAEAGVAAASAESATAQKTAAEGMQTEAVAAGGVTAALEGQAAAATEVETVLEMKSRIAMEAANRELDAQAALSEAHLRAIFAVRALGEATLVGGKQMAAAYTEAQAAVSQFEQKVLAAVAINKSFVSPATIADLSTFNQRVEGASTSMEKATSATSKLHAEANIASGSVGGLARGVAGMGGSFASVVLPITAALVGLDLIPEIVERIDSKTKEWAASLVGLIYGLHEEEIAVRKSNESREAYEARIKTILDLRDQLVRASIAMSAGLIQEETDVGKAVVAWEAYKFAHGVAIQQLPELEKAAKAMGLSFRETHEGMAREAQIFFSLYAGLLKKDGEQAANAWAEAHKAALDKLISEYQRAGIAVPPELAKIAAAINLYTTASKEAAQSKELHDKILDEANVSKVLVAEIQRLAGVMGSEQAAAKALAPLILERIAALEKLKTANAADEAIRKAALDSLTALAAKYGLVEGAMGKVIATSDKVAATWKDHQLKLAELNKEYDNHVKAVSNAADKAVADVNREADAVGKSLAKQILDLKDEHNQMLISDSEYFEKVNLLSAAQNLAANAAAAERDRINQKERDDLDKLAEKHRETTEKLQEGEQKTTAAMTKTAEAVDNVTTSLTKDWDPLRAEVGAVGQSFVDMATKAAEAGQKIAPAWGDVVPSLDNQIKNLAVSSDLLATRLDAAAGGGLKTIEMFKLLKDTTHGIPALIGDIGVAALSVFGDVATGGPEPRPEPAPEPTGAAPGGEFTE